MGLSHFKQKAHSFLFPTSDCASPYCHLSPIQACFTPNLPQHTLGSYFCWFSSVQGNHIQSKTLNKRSILFSSPLQAALACIAHSAPYKPVSHLSSPRHMLGPYFCWFSSVQGNHIQSKCNPQLMTSPVCHCMQYAIP